MGRFSLARLDLRARVVLFTSAIVVGALLLLGAALHALLAKSLYTQQSDDAVQQVTNLTRQAAAAALADTAGLTSTETQRRLREELTRGSGGGQPSFKGVVLRNADTTSESDRDYRIEYVPLEGAKVHDDEQKTYK